MKFISVLRGYFGVHSKSANAKFSSDQNNSVLQAALVGHPNCGKTALFNALTGLRQRVGNWSGVTVSRKQGRCRAMSAACDLVDLPGIQTTFVYEQDSMAIDASIACEYLLHNDLDLIVNVVDASQLERHLYLTLQLRRLGVPMVLVLNMHDVAQRRGMQIDIQALQDCLGCPVVAVVATKSRGISSLQAAMEQAVSQKTIAQVPEFLEPPLQQLADNISTLLQAQLQLSVAQAVCFANRFLSGDQWVLKQWPEQLRLQVQELCAGLHDEYPDGFDIAMANAAFNLCADVAAQVITQVTAPATRWTQRIDRIVLHRWFGLPIFFLIMYALFFFSINIGGAFQDFFDISSTTLLVDGLSHLLTQWHCPVWLVALLAHGIGKGVNTTITFIPVIGALFLFLCFLEDCGYMARAAFVVDRLMVRLGLPGKSFVPMIVGFGCNVPAVMGARTLQQPRDRILAVMMMPFMSCGARLAIFSVFAAAFFPHGGQDIIFLLYILGVAVAMLTGWLLRSTVLPGKPAPLLMVLPDYHWPQKTALFRHAWQRLQAFLWRAGRYIVVVCTVVGVLNTVTFSHYKLQPAVGSSTLLAQIGRGITPIFSPMGVKQDNWPATVGLLTGVLAKEVVVGTLNSLYSQSSAVSQPVALGDFSWRAGLTQAVYSVPANLRDLSTAWQNPLLASEADHDMDHDAMGQMLQRFGGAAAAFAYLVFVLLYFPCISTMAAMRRELGWSWALFSMAWTTGLAYVLAVCFYQLLAVFPVMPLSACWHTGLALLVLLATVWGMRLYAQQQQPELPAGA